MMKIKFFREMFNDFKGQERSNLCLRSSDLLNNLHFDPFYVWGLKRLFLQFKTIL